MGSHRIRSKSLSSFAALWVSALWLVAVLAGCGGENVQTTATLGVGGRVGDIVVRDAALRFDGPVAGDTVYQAGDDAALQLTIVNEGDRPDRLVRVRSPIARLGVIIGDASIAGHQVPAAGYRGHLASATLPGTDAVRIMLVGLRSPVRAGLRYPVVFHFEQAGELRLNLPVENPHTLRSPPDQPPL